MIITRDMHASAIVIQSHARGFLARRKLYDQLAKEIGSMAEASGGSTRVYLPKQLSSIVLKHSGGNSAGRLKQMRAARVIVESLKIENLVIPTAILCGDKQFLAEKRIKGFSVDPEVNQKIYFDNPAAFDRAAQEMTRLFSKVYISNLISSGREQKSFFCTEIAEQIPRFDNIPFFFRQRNGELEGCVALIDLENIEFEPNEDALQVIAAIFPKHVGVIQEEAARLKMEQFKPIGWHQTGFHWARSSSDESHAQRVQELKVLRKLLKEEKFDRIAEPPDLKLMEGEKYSPVDSVAVTSPLFNEAIRQLVRLFSQVKIPALLSREEFYRDSNYRITKETLNLSAIVPFLENNKGKFAILRGKNIIFEQKLYSIPALIETFPHYKKEILRELKMPDLSPIPGFLEDGFHFEKYESDESEFKKLYHARLSTSHAEFLKKNNITQGDVEKMMCISPERMGVISKEVVKGLLKYRTSEYDKYLLYSLKSHLLLSDQVRQLLKGAEELAPKIVSVLVDSLKQILLENPNNDAMHTLRPALKRIGVSEQVHNFVKCQRIDIAAKFLEFIKGEQEYLVYPHVQSDIISIVLCGLSGNEIAYDHSEMTLNIAHSINRGECTIYY